MPQTRQHATTAFQGIRPQIGLYPLNLFYRRVDISSSTVRNTRTQRELIQFYEGWANGEVKDHRGTILKIPNHFWPPYEIGSEALYNAIPLAANPYKFDDPKYWFWRSGWIDSFREFTKPPAKENERVQKGTT